MRDRSERRSWFRPSRPCARGPTPAATGPARAPAPGEGRPSSPMLLPAIDAYAASPPVTAAVPRCGRTRDRSAARRGRPRNRLVRRDADGASDGVAVTARSSPVAIAVAVAIAAGVRLLCVDAPRTSARRTATRCFDADGSRRIEGGRLGRASAAQSDGRARIAPASPYQGWHDGLRPRDHGGAARGARAGSSSAVRLVAHAHATPSRRQALQ